MLADKASLKKDLLLAEERACNSEGVATENGELKAIIDSQHVRIQEYEEEVANTKEHMERLEQLIQKIQEDRLTSAHLVNHSPF